MACCGFACDHDERNLSSSFDYNQLDVFAEAYVAVYLVGIVYIKRLPAMCSLNVIPLERFFIPTLILERNLLQRTFMLSIGISVNVCRCTMHFISE